MLTSPATTPAPASQEASLSTSQPSPATAQSPSAANPAEGLTGYASLSTASDADVRLAVENGFYSTLPAAAEAAPASAPSGAPVEEDGRTDAPAAEAPEAAGEEIAPEAATTEAEPAAEAAAPETPGDELAQLRARLAELEAKAEAEEKPSTVGAVDPLPALPPLPDNPLINLRAPAQLEAAEKTARELKAWAFKNRDGGEVPVALAQAAENAEAARLGRKPGTITAPVELDSERVADLHNSAEALLTDYLPRRWQQLKDERAALSVLRQQNPEFLDPKDQRCQLSRQFAHQFPALMQYPDWPLVIRDLVTGYLQNRKAEGGSRKATPAKPTAPLASTGRPVPVAPRAPIGGNAPGGIPVSQSVLRQAEERVSKNAATDDDWRTLFAAAV